jgi:beta-aspartyl-peptidase (threonine type)
MSRDLPLLLALLILATIAGGCASGRSTPARPDWAIALHAGAGVIDKNASDTERREHVRSLEAALRAGSDRLAAGGTAIDAVELVVRILEDDPRFNAGRGAAFTADGRHELDACIMDGRTLACGAVAGVTTVRNPVSLARLVMERTGHVLLARDGAEAFADTVGVERVDNAWFDTPKRRQMLDEWRAAQPVSTASAARSSATRFGTVGAVALDRSGNLAAATSTGGLTGKRFGRVGDSPIVGAGTLADNASCAVSCTGTGEEFIRHSVARDIAARIKYLRRSPEQAARDLVFSTLKPDDGGVIVLGADGRIAMAFSSEGMFRAAADSTGRREVAIWDRNEPLEGSP